MKLYFITAHSLTSGDIFAAEITDGILDVKAGTVSGIPGFDDDVVIYNNLDHGKVRAKLVGLLNEKMEAIAAVKRKATKAAMRDTVEWVQASIELILNDDEDAPIPDPKREAVVTSDGSA